MGKEKVECPLFGPRRGVGAGFVVLLGGLLVWTAMAAFLRRGHVGDIFDDGLYFVSAQSLSRGDGYTLPSQVGPSTRSRYPVGLPALVAIALKVAPGTPSLERDAWVAKAVMLGLAWVFFLASYVWLRRVGAPTPWAVLAVLATAFDPTVTMLSIAVMSDVPLAAVVMLEAARWVGRRHRRRGWTVWNVVNGAIAGAGLTVRITGVALLPASVLASRRGGGRLWPVLGTLAVGLGTALIVLPARLVVAAGGGRASGSYGNEFLAGWTSLDAGRLLIVRNVTDIVSRLPQVAQPLFFTRAAQSRPLLSWSAWSVLAVFLVVGLAALARSSRRRDLPAWLYACLTLGIFVVWSGPFTHRFVVSLFPMLLLALARGAETCVVGLGGRRRLGLAAGAGVLGLCLAGELAFLGPIVARSVKQGGFWGDLEVRGDLDATLGFIRERLEPDAVIVSMMPETVYLYTGRQGALLLREVDKVRDELGRPELMLGRMDEAPGRPFYLMGPRPGAEATPEAAQSERFARHPALLVEERYRSPHGRLWVAKVARRGREDGIAP